MCKADGFNVLLKARRYSPLVPPELVPLQIRFHRREEFLNLCEFRARDLGDFLALPLRHDTMEEEDEFLGEVCYISTSLSGEGVESNNRSGFD